MQTSAPLTSIISYFCAQLSNTSRPVAAPNVYYYNSSKTNNTYVLNTNPMNFKSAQSFCNGQGGHLVSYKSYDEQVDVEQHFVKQVRRLNQPRFTSHPSPCVFLPTQL